MSDRVCTNRRWCLTPCACIHISYCMVWASRLHYGMQLPTTNYYSFRARCELSYSENGENEHRMRKKSNRQSWNEQDLLSDELNTTHSHTVCMQYVLVYRQFGSFFRVLSRASIYERKHYPQTAQTTNTHVPLSLSLYLWVQLNGYRSFRLLTFSWRHREFNLQLSIIERPNQWILSNQNKEWNRESTQRILCCQWAEYNPRWSDSALDFIWNSKCARPLTQPRLKKIVESRAKPKIGKRRNWYAMANRRSHMAHSTHTRRKDAQQKRIRNFLIPRDIDIHITRTQSARIFGFWEIFVIFSVQRQKKCMNKKSKGFLLLLLFTGFVSYGYNHIHRNQFWTQHQKTENTKTEWKRKRGKWETNKCREFGIFGIVAVAMKEEVIAGIFSQYNRCMSERKQIQKRINDDRRRKRRRTNERKNVEMKKKQFRMHFKGVTVHR